MHNAGSDTAFGPTITARPDDEPTNVLTDNLDAGTWLAFAEVGIFNNGDDATSVECGIFTDGTRRETAAEDIEAILDDSGWKVNLPLTATFSTSTPDDAQAGVQQRRVRRRRRAAAAFGGPGGDPGRLGGVRPG